jgi:hypothetical protein
MANKKISELDALTSVDGDELLEIVDDPGGTPVSKKITRANLVAGLSADTHAHDVTGSGGDIAINDTAYVTLASGVFDIAAGDAFLLECDFLILNNSGGARTYSYAVDINGLVAEFADGATIAASATNHAPTEMRGSARIYSSSLAYAMVRMYHPIGVAADTRGAFVLNNTGMGWDSTASDLTGSSKTVALKIKSSAATATQTARVLAFRIRRIPA